MTRIENNAYTKFLEILTDCLKMATGLWLANLWSRDLLSICFLICFYGHVICQRSNKLFCQVQRRNPGKEVYFFFAWVFSNPPFWPPRRPWRRGLSSALLSLTGIWSGGKCPHVGNFWFILLFVFLVSFLWFCSRNINFLFSLSIFEATVSRVLRTLNMWFLTPIPEARFKRRAFDKIEWLTDWLNEWMNELTLFIHSHNFNTIGFQISRV